MAAIPIAPLRRHTSVILTLVTTGTEQTRICPVAGTISYSFDLPRMAHAKLLTQVSDQYSVCFQYQVMFSGRLCRHRWLLLRDDFIPGSLESSTSSCFIYYTWGHVGETLLFFQGLLVLGFGFQIKTVTRWCALISVVLVADGVH